MEHTIITSKTPGLLPLGQDITNCVVVRHAEHINKRVCFAKTQLVRATGGFGCRASSMGNAVFVTPLWVVEGDNTIREGNKDDGWREERYNLLGQASDELVEMARSQPDTAPPLDPNDMQFLLIAAGNGWSRADTVKECMSKLGIRSLKEYWIGIAHAEAYVDDWGSTVKTPHAAVVGDRPTVRWLYQGLGKAPKAADVESEGQRVIKWFKEKEAA